MQYVRSNGQGALCKMQYGQTSSFYLKPWPVCILLKLPSPTKALFFLWWWVQPTDTYTGSTLLLSLYQWAILVQVLAQSRTIYLLCYRPTHYPKYPALSFKLVYSPSPKLKLNISASAWSTMLWPKI